jgi:carnitine monooxygenase subunit
MSKADDFSLPSWAYTDPEFLALERERIFRPSWQVICHVSEIPNPGDYQVFDFIGEMLFALRGNDGQVRVFHNVCRHRAARLLDGPRGHCTRRIICPYHSWSYDLEGKLASVGGDRSAFPDLDISRESLVPAEMEIYAGFVFARVQGNGPSVKDMLAPYAEEIATHEFEKLEPIGRVVLRPRTVNWKNVGDNYSDALHIPVAHPGLTRLFGASYRVESKEWVDRMSGELSDKPSKNWAERMYQKHLPDAPHLGDKRRTWVYFKLWPNFAFDVYPDQVDIMQWLPVSPTTCLIREIGYAKPDARREMKVARYCNWRINRQVNAEDTVLIQRVQDGMASGSYQMGPLAAGEVALRSFGARLRQLIPESRQPSPPPAGWSRATAAH